MICTIPPPIEIVLAYTLSDPHNAIGESYTLLFLFTVRNVKINWPKPDTDDVHTHFTAHSFVSIHSPYRIYTAPPYVVAEQLRNEDNSTSILELALASYEMHPPCVAPVISEKPQWETYTFNAAVLWIVLIFSFLSLNEMYLKFSF